jgi:hypothetical protein
MRSRPMWRAFPSPLLADIVRHMALAEGRSDSNMIVRLVSEAVQARQTADHQVTKLVDAIRTVAAPVK